jgi:hypothetical protein
MVREGWLQAWKNKPTDLTTPGFLRRTEQERAAPPNDRKSLDLIGTRIDHEQQVALVHDLAVLVATGAGAEMRQSLGTAVFFGMLGVTLFGLLFTPTFYAVVRRLSGNESRSK